MPSYILHINHIILVSRIFLVNNLTLITNTAETCQRAPSGVLWSGYILFAHDLLIYIPHKIVEENRQHICIKERQTLNYYINKARA